MAEKPYPLEPQIPIPGENNGCVIKKDTPLRMPDELENSDEDSTRINRKPADVAQRQLRDLKKQNR